METEQIKKFIKSVVPDVENGFVIGFAFIGGLYGASNYINIL